MGPNAVSRSRSPLASPATYWRRRVIVLMLGIGVLAVLAWAVNGTVSAPGAQAQGTAGSRAGSGGGHQGGQGTGAAASPAPAHSSRPGSSSAAKHAGGGRTSATSSPRPSASAGASGSPTSSPTPASHSGGHSSHQPATCHSGDVVLSLTSPRYWYTSGQMPKFTVDVVSTASHSCSFNVGARSLAVVVSSGTTEVWSSADCAPKPGSRVVTLSRGVPEVVGISWDRETSSSGCQGKRRSARLGAYTATAVSGHLRSKAKIFVLGGQGVAVP